ncbi:BTAD domain-containing putative transcriptional regulator [Streptomyces sp. NPDC004609]|uniref:AfsR/SARP family transcriptional regulator n=1 Tax=Streptomyces sp. NPDC004609 TaxID=3364704 RepID=UPI00369849CA
MHYRVLGTTQALRADGTPAAVGGARLRALLAVLALRAGRAVPVGALVDEVWGGDPPADASGALQALVGRLRRAVGPGAVLSVDGGYRLDADPDAVDLHRFTRLAGEGTRALEEGDPAKAVTLLEDALALWQGPPLADLPHSTAETARLEVRHLEARRARLGALLGLGRADEALPELAALCHAFPIDEPLQALRVRALRDTGRPAEALAAYEEVRRELSSRLGTDPGPRLRALHRELLSPAEPAGPAGPARTARPAARPGGHPAPDGPSGPAQGRNTAVEAPPRAGPHPPGTTPPASPTAPAPHPADAPPAPPAPEPHADARTPAGYGPGHPLAAVSAPAAARREGATAPGRTVAAAPPPAGNLRARLTSFVGRGEDIAAIRGDLGRARLVTLMGPGGAGKTRLSQEAAERVAGDHPDGVWLAELAPVDDPATVPEAVLTALGARQTVLRGAGTEEIRAGERAGDDSLTRLTEHCARRRMLLLLDNCEHVVEAAAVLAERLLESCPGLTVLATSREPLGVPGEVVRQVDPLPDPMALRLLADRGAAARPGFRVDGDREAAEEICRRLDGLPLAIELAAARLRMLTPRQIADRLDDRFRLLTSGSRTVLPRQQTLRAVVDWSWELLQKPERAVLRRLSVFAGGCDLAAAEAVCPDTEHGAPDVAAVLGSLIDKSLVVAVPAADGGMRYRLLETVAEYAAGRLDEAAERAAVERRHLTYYRELARTTDPLLRGAGQGAAIALIQREYENLRTALRRATAARDEQESLSLVLSLAWYWQMRDLRTEARHWAETVRALGPDPFAPPATPAPPVFERFTDAPPPMGPELLAEARRANELVRLACMNHVGDEWTTPSVLERLRVISRTYRAGLPQTCRFPGALWFFAVLLTEDVGALRTLLDGTVDACRSYGYEWELASALQSRANVLANRSRWAGDAVTDAQESLEIFVRLGDSWGAAEALSARAEAQERRGEYAAAARDYTAAVEHAERIGARAQVAVLHARLGGVLMETGDGERGEAIVREVIAGQDGALSEAAAYSRLLLALWLGRTGRSAQARAELLLLLDHFRSHTMALFEGMVTGCLSRLDFTDGRYEDALRRVESALPRARNPLGMMVAPQLVALHLITGAGALAGGWPERAADAARVMGAADAQLPPGHFSSPYEREHREQVEATVRAALGDAAYEAAYAAGAGLSVDEAGALVGVPAALRSSGGTGRPPAAP